MGATTPFMIKNQLGALFSCELQKYQKLIRKSLDMPSLGINGTRTSCAVSLHHVG